MEESPWQSAENYWNPKDYEKQIIEKSFSQHPLNILGVEFCKYVGAILT